jgi:hypothetical protein
MRSIVSFLFAAAVLSPLAAVAQVQPHRAEYTLRLGNAVNAPRVGTAVHDLTQDCAGWHLKRDIKAEIALTASWKISLSSKLDSEETRNGFRYSLGQVQNGAQREVKGRLQRQGSELRAEISPTGSTPSQFTLPPPTLLPTAAIGHLIERLAANAKSFPALMFDAEVIGNAFLVEATEQDRATVRGPRPADRPVALPQGKSWPVFMNFSRGNQDQKPLFSVNALVFDNGVLDRLTVETGLLTVTADLASLEMHKAPVCPRS